MNTTLKRSLENAIVLFLLSIVSALIVDYQAHGYPPDPGVIYISLLTALWAFLTTMGMQTRKKRKEKKEAEERGKEIEKIINGEISSEHNSPKDVLPSQDPDPPKNERGDDWIPGMVI